MRRAFPLIVVIGLLVIGALITVQSRDNGLRLTDPASLPAEASVFQTTPQQTISLVIVSSIIAGSVVGMGVGLAVIVPRIDAIHRSAQVADKPVDKAKEAPATQGSQAVST